MILDANYNQLKPGGLMGIPTTTNVKFTYKSDGPMDPRYVMYKFYKPTTEYCFTYEAQHGTEQSGHNCLLVYSTTFSNIPKLSLETASQYSKNYSSAA